MLSWHVQWCGTRSHGRRFHHGHAPFAPRHGTETEVSGINELLCQQHSQRASGCRAAEAHTTSLTTIDRVVKFHPVHASMTCANTAWTVKFSSAMSGCWFAWSSKMHAKHTSPLLKLQVSGSGLRHGLASPRRSPGRELSAPQYAHRSQSSGYLRIDIRFCIAKHGKGPGRGAVTKFTL